MSEDQLINSFGDPNAQPPPTPKQTPASIAFPSPIFETPKPPQGSFAEPSGQTPRYAEDYSVFNATPGNLRGNQGPFADFISTDLIGSSLGHKRLLSAETIAVEIASRGNLTSPHPGIRLPPVEPCRRLPSSPAVFLFPKGGASAEPELQLSPNLPPHGKSSKKIRRGTLTLPSSEATQVLSPPPSAHKGGKKLAPKVTKMQDDQRYGQQHDFENLQAHEMAALMGGHAGDLYGYPMSAPGATHGSFWDASAMSMDIDFATAQASFFQPSHRHTGSFDWNSDIPLFQDPVPPPPAPTPASTTGQNAQTTRRERALAPKPPASAQVLASAKDVRGPGMPTAFSGSVDDPYGLMSPVDGVDPGLLHSRPSTSSMNAEFNHVVNTGTTGASAAESRNLQAGLVPRRAKSTKETRKGKMTDRSHTGGPGKLVGNRPCLGRSLSDNRGKKAPGRTLPASAPVVRPIAQAGGPISSVDGGKAGARPPGSGRTSPVKSQRRLSSLASIPESMSQSQPQLSRPRTSVRFTIDASGRARAETTLLMEEPGACGIARSRSSRELSGRSSWSSSDDESSTDEEPIIIPSRSNSLNTSFALPDARKTTGSWVQSSRFYGSEGSTNPMSVRDGSSGPPHDGESEAETALTEHEKGGDAASELRKVVQDRQKRSLQMEIARTQRTLSTTTSTTPLGPFNDNTISPVSLTDSTYGTNGQGVRCVCSGKEMDEGHGYMIQCESCEMWLHGKCVNITRHNMPSVYICGFCANTGLMAGSRKGNMGERASILSPVKEKLFRAFRYRSKGARPEVVKLSDFGTQLWRGYQGTQAPASICSVIIQLDCNFAFASQDPIPGQNTASMAEHNIVVFAGDHAGPEVIAEAIKVLRAVEEHSPTAGKFNLQHHLLGGCSIDATGEPLTQTALAAAQAADAVLLGAIGGPKWGTGAVRPEQGLLRLRKELGTYGNLRPCFFASEALVDSSPLKPEVCRGVDMVIVRELTGGIYFGARKEDDDGSGTAWDTEPYSRDEVARVARLAGFLALARGERAVWSLDKANVLATSRLWRRVMEEVFAAEFPGVEVRHQLIDSAAMILVKNPRALNGVVVTSNLFGDIISDEASVIPGSIGLLPSASLSGIPDGKGRCNGIYEPIHGSAPDISGKGVVNPVGTILSVAMMLRYSLNLVREAEAVEDAVRRAIDAGLRTGDMGGQAGTKEAGDEVVKHLIAVLQQ